MRRRLLPLILCGALTLSLTSPYSTYANEEIDQKISDIEKKIKESESKKNSVSKKLEENKAKQEEERRTLSQLEAELEKTKGEIESINNEIAETESTLDKTKKELKKAEKRVAERDALLQERVRLLYENGKVSYLEVLFQATSFSDFLSRFDAVRVVSERDKELLEENRRDRESVAANKVKIEQSLANLDKLREEVKEKRNLLAKQEKEHQTKLAALQKEQGQLETISEEEEQAVNNLIAQLAKAEAEKEEWKRKEAERKRQEEARKKQEVAAQSGNNSRNPESNPPSSNSEPVPSASGFTWPVPGYGVTSSFGNRFHPIHHRWKLHAGIDIGAPQGTAILAAADGKVTAARASSGYGNIVVIYHGDGISTKYAHMPYNSITVTPGQQVKAGQQIASVGMEGTATAPHLHFEVLKWGTPINPMQFY